MRPTYTHEAIQKLMELGYIKHVISQNCDGLHRLSGVPAQAMSELHGNVFTEVCEKCQRRYNRSFYVLDDTASEYYEELEDFGETDIVKPVHASQCKLCGLSHRTGRRCTQKVKSSPTLNFVSHVDLKSHPPSSSPSRLLITSECRYKQ